MLDTLICNVDVYDGSGSPPFRADVGVRSGRIEVVAESGSLASERAVEVVSGAGQALAPGFIDAHSHDDLAVLRQPRLEPKLSQGVTTVVVGNCGISASPVRLRGSVPDPMNLLGAASDFRFPSFEHYVRALSEAAPAVNVAALVGHTSLRQNHMDRLDRAATAAEIEAMKRELESALRHGALGLSTGLAYQSAAQAPTAEVLALGEPLAEAHALYCTHLRSESAEILSAMKEAFAIGEALSVPVVISHLKCAGPENYGRSREVLDALESAARTAEVGCDCYPYSASSSTLDLSQVRDEVEVFVTFSEPHPELGGRSLRAIAEYWGVSLQAAARRLQPAGAVYHCMAERDVERILLHPQTVIGSDGLPGDPRPHPRLWGAFARVLGHYVRERKLLSLAQAVHKMTGQSAARYGLIDRGLVREGACADLVLFDPATVADTATFDAPIRPARGITAVWVNGVLSHGRQANTGKRAGRFLARQPRT